jgi:hypothetical protein
MRSFLTTGTGRHDGSHRVDSFDAPLQPASSDEFVRRSSSLPERKVLSGSPSNVFRYV